MTFDFKEYIEDNFDPKHQQMNPDEVMIHCINPDCDDNWRRRRKMAVNLAKKKAFCFKCGERYNDVKFVSQAEGVSKFEAFKIVRSTAPIRTFGANRLQTAIKEITEPDLSADSEEEKLESCKFPPWRKIVLGTEEWEYLNSRNISQEVIDHFGLIYSPFGPYVGRIIIPVCKDGKAISFQARTIRGAEPKYLFPIDQPFGSELYNWDHAKYYGEIIITEGVTDAWRVWTFGYHNVTATFGKSLKVNQEKIIKQEDRIKKVIMLWDGGTLPDAYEAGLRLSSTKEVLIAELPDKLDPDDCPDTPHYIENAKPIHEFNRLTVALSKL